MEERTDRRELGRYDFEGFCDPTTKDRVAHKYKFSTFSVRVFQWITKRNGKDLKKSKAVYRIRGRVEDAFKVHRRAEEICDKLEDGWEPTMKSETLK